MKFRHWVWDGKKFEVPEPLGKPRADQLQGSELDNLTELSGRACYDSLGTGRNSVDYHKHIIEVNHGSVQEHGNLTFLIPALTVPDYLSCCETLLNRPGFWSIKEIKPNLTGPGMLFDLRVTGNMRSVREWFKFPAANKWTQLLGETLQNLAKDKAPLIFSDMEKHDIGMSPCTVVEPKYEEEHWVSLFFTNVSRGFSHELVRHKFRTAVSQRSTRYVDEGDSDWCWHPLILKHIQSDDTLIRQKSQFQDGSPCESAFSLKSIQGICQDGYKALVDKLQAQLITDGADKFTARKQARGAARGLLGNALLTEMVFSASLTEWKWMLKLRANSAADAEIRVVFNEVFTMLSERFPSAFQGWTKHDCPDGLGYELREPAK